MDHYSRCTGHTSRMLREAIILILCGKTVAVIAATEYLAKDFAKNTKRIAERLGIQKSDAWDWGRIDFFGARKFAEMKQVWEKAGVVVMGDPGLNDIAERRGIQRIGLPIPPEWPV